MKKKVYVSIKPNSGSQGGGSNSFAWNLQRYMVKNKIPVTKYMLCCSIAIIIAHRVNLMALRAVKARGCFIIHRVDEDFGEVKELTKKHKKIIKVNKLADKTVFQSEFVKNDLMPHLRSKDWTIILNGADPSIFTYQRDGGKYIGHVTNGVGGKKRLDLLEQTIKEFRKEQFLLVGNHNKSSIDFTQYDNVKMVGAVAKHELRYWHKQMKCLYFPSERDPCPNTVVEAILSGVPICYNKIGGTKEIVKNCGLPLDQFNELLGQLSMYRERCSHRQDLYFDSVAKQYLSL